MEKIIDNIIFGLLYGLVWLLSLLPLKTARALGKRFGRVFHWIDKKHRNIVLDNLSHSFPDKDRGWIEKTCTACFEHLGQVIMEIPYLVRWPHEKLLDHVRIHGAHNGFDAWKHNKGVLLLTGHIGNWEWAGALMAVCLQPGCVVARSLDFKPADKLVNLWRQKGGNEVVPKARSARRLLKELRANGMAGILLDQNVDWYDGEWVDFFGRPACSNKGLALLAMAKKAPVVPVYVQRSDDGCFDLYADPPVELVDTGDKLQDVWENTQNYTKALERAIMRKPEQWFWLHQRWKTKPYHNWPREK